MFQHYANVWKKIVDFSGRSRRSEYWYFVLVNLIIQYGLIGIGLALEMPALAMVSSVYSLAVILPSISVAIRRMHDAGKSGWFCLIPIYNIILAATDSEPGTNKWGPNPKGIGGGVTQASDHLII